MGNQINLKMSLKSELDMPGWLNQSPLLQGKKVSRAFGWDKNSEKSRYNKFEDIFRIMKNVFEIKKL